MFFDYMEEEEGKKILKSDHAFIAYRVIGNELFVTDLFVKKEYRNRGHGLALAQTLPYVAKENKCVLITCNIFILPHNKDRAAEKVRLYSKFGFSIESANNNVITMIMEVK